MSNHSPPPYYSGRTAHLVLLAVVFFFIFAGAGAQQQYLVPYLSRITPWGGLQRAGLLAVVYAFMMIFRVGNLYLLRRWPDWKWRAVGSATYVLFPAGMALLAVVPSYWLALGFAALWGWGAAAMWGGTTMEALALSEGPRNRYGLGVGLLYGGTHAGYLTGVIGLGLLYGYYPDHPQLLYIIAAVVTLLGVLVSVALPRGSQAQMSAPSARVLGQILRKPGARIASFLIASSALAYGLMLGAFAEFVTVRYGAEWVWITAMFFPALRIVCALLSGIISDIAGRGLVLTVAFLLGAVGCGLAAMWDSLVALGFMAGILGLVNASVPVVTSSLIGDSAQRKRRPLAYGVIFIWNDFGVVTALVLSRLLDTQGVQLQSTFVIFAVVFALCSGVAALLGRYTQQGM